MLKNGGPTEVSDSSLNQLPSHLPVTTSPTSCIAMKVGITSRLDRLYISPRVSILLLIRSTFATVTSLLVITLLNFMAIKERGCPSCPYSEFAVSKDTIVKHYVIATYVAYAVQ